MVKYTEFWKNFLMVCIDRTSLMMALIDGTHSLKSRGAFGWDSSSLPKIVEAAEIVTPASLLGEPKVDMAKPKTVGVFLDVTPSLEETTAIAVEVDTEAVPLTL